MAVNKQRKFDHSKSNMSDENAEDDELYEVTMASAVVEVTARDHVPRRRNVRNGSRNFHLGTPVKGQANFG